MKKLIHKDKKNRFAVKVFERKRFILKSIIKNISFSKLIRWNAVVTFSNLPSNSSETFIINCCIETGRKKRINKHFNFSRLEFLKFVRSGNIHGFRKSCW
jgi:ribosomal protein S14